MTTAISTDKLVKTFGSFRALDGLDLSVRAGEVHGFLGPNGAGKSTTIRILLGLLRKDSGEVSVLGGAPWRDAVSLHRRLAYVPGDVSLWPNLSGGEAIDLFGTLRGGMNHVRRNELIERFALDPAKKCRTYSKGNRQKVALVSAFSSDVELLILDEPTSGLDPLMDAEFRECVRAAAQQGTTVLLSSHSLAEVEALCERVSIIRDGRTVEAGSLDELRHLTRVSISVETEHPVHGLENHSGVHGLRVDGRHAEFDVDTAELGSVHRRLSELGVRALTSAPPTLEELFLRHYGNGTEQPSARGDGAGVRA